MTSTQTALLAADLAVVILLANLLGTIAQRLGQPRVIGEITAGLLACPTFLGALAEALFPAPIRNGFEALSDIGIVLFMFTLGVGVGVGHNERTSIRSAVGIGFGSFVLPFAAGATFALFVTGHAGAKAHGSTAFILFIGTAMSVTAFPVLARILVDLDLQASTLGGLGLSAAAVCDVAAWTMLAVSIAVAHASTPPVRLIGVIPFIGILLVLSRPIFRRLSDWADQNPSRSSTISAAALAATFACAALTEILGLHIIFGGFLFGMCCARGLPAGPTLDTITGQADRIAAVLLPVFFVAAGLKADLRMNMNDVVLLAAIVAVASSSKIVGAYLGARAIAVGHHRALVVAGLMNTRGLTELVTLTTGLGLGIIDRTLYSLMVCMTLITTVVTGPLLRQWAVPDFRCETVQ